MIRKEERIAGFLLLELVVSLFIVGVTIGGCLIAIRQLMRLESVSEGYVTASEILDNELEKLRMEDFLVPGTVTSEEQRLGKTFILSRTVRQSNFDSLYAVETTIQWEVSSGIESWTVRTLHPKDNPLRQQ